MRALLNGVNIQVSQFVIGYDQEYCIQVARGSIALNAEKQITSGTVFPNIPEPTQRMKDGRNGHFVVAKPWQTTSVRALPWQMRQP